jgi:hypothetical protein
MMKAQAGAFAVHVPYRGAAPALTDLLAGQIDFLFDPGIAIPHVKAGRLKMLAVGSPKRSPLFPDVPTLDEVGLKGFDADTVFGFYAPAGSPPDVINKLNGEINRILATPALRDRINALGGEPAPMTPAQLQPGRRRRSALAPSSSARSSAMRPPDAARSRSRIRGVHWVAVDWKEEAVSNRCGCRGAGHFGGWLLCDRAELNYSTGERAGWVQEFSTRAGCARPGRASSRWCRCRAPRWRSSFSRCATTPWPRRSAR